MARPRHRQSVFVVACHFLIIIFYVAATCRPSVLGSATKTRPPVAKQSGQCARALKVRFLNISGKTRTSSSMHSYKIVLVGAARLGAQIDARLFLNIDAVAIGYLRCEGLLLLTLIYSMHNNNNIESIYCLLQEENVY